VFSSGPAPGTVRPNASTDVRTALTNAGAAAFGRGTLTLTFTVTGGGTAQIMSLRPVFYTRQARQPSWVFIPEGGCGDTYQRVFDLNLDRRTMTDLGTQGNPDTMPASSARPMTGQIGSPFHLSGNDPATVTIIAHACSQQYFEWGLDVTYQLDGHVLADHIASPAAPLRLTGTLPHAAPAYTFNMNDPNGPLVGAHMATQRKSPGCTP
jgi:hypothetical protein